jgi:hypothetical protein
MAQSDKQTPPPGRRTIPTAWQRLFDTEYKVVQGRFEGWRDREGLLGQEYDWPQQERSEFDYDFCLRYAPLDLARHGDEVRKAYAAEAFEAMKVRARAIRRFVSRRVRRPKVQVPKAEDVKGKPLGPKAHASNWELVCFVAERLIPFEQLRAGNLLPGRHGPQVWARLREEWNRLHPHHLERKDSDKTIPREYRRAVAVTVEEIRYPTPLARSLLKQVKADFDEEWKPWEELRQANARLRAGLSDAERAQRRADEEAFMAKVRVDIERSSQEWVASRDADEGWQELRRLRQGHRAFLDSLSPEGREAYEQAERLREQAERQQFRDSLTRRELIHKRVFLLLQEKDELSEKDKQILAAPLRDWFLT